MSPVNVCSLYSVLIFCVHNDVEVSWDEDITHKLENDRSPENSQDHYLISDSMETNSNTINKTDEQHTILDEAESHSSSMWHHIQISHYFFVSILILMWFLLMDMKYMDVCTAVQWESKLKCYTDIQHYMTDTDWNHIRMKERNTQRVRGIKRKNKK